MLSKATDEIVATVMADWQKKLLQLDRRNNLLYFKPGRAIEIVNTTVDGLTEQLIASRNGLSFDFVEPPRRGGRGSFSLDDDVDEEEEAEPVVIPGEIDTLLTTPDLLRRLRTLRRKDREWEEG